MPLETEILTTIDDCLDCYSECLSAVVNHCLEIGGEYAEPAHVRLMLACAEVCRTSAHLMLMGSNHHASICSDCAEICDQCADQCERLGGLKDCVTFVPALRAKQPPHGAGMS